MAAHGLYTWDITPNWSKIKFDRMRLVLRAKFEQHPNLRKILLDSGDARLVEAGTVNNAVNRLWGEVNGVGRNMLGVMLMELRADFPDPAQENRRTGRGTASYGEPTLRLQTAGPTQRRCDDVTL